MTPHIDPGTLGALAEGGLTRTEAVRVRAHLAECRSCMAAYTDAVRYRAAWLAQPESFEADDDLIATARSVGAGVVVRPVRTSRGTAGLPRVRALAAGLAVLAVVAVAPRFFAGKSPSAVSIPPAVRGAVERMSGEGLVLPGGERGANRGSARMRSSEVGSSPELERELRAALAEYERGGRRREAGIRAATALLASGELDAALDYTREALRLDPGNVPMLVLASDIAYRRSDVGRARDLLEQAARKVPRDPLVALDLGLVLRQQGRDPEARALLRRAARSNVPELAARARRELGE